jgi:hypothetical protein
MHNSGDYTGGQHGREQFSWLRITKWEVIQNKLICGIPTFEMHEQGEVDVIFVCSEQNTSDILRKNVSKTFCWLSIARVFGTEHYGVERTGTRSLKQLS